jgi:Zn-dependent protease with chaperone function
VDFFGAQDRARSRTWQLFALFSAAVVALVLATNVLIALVARFSSTAGLAQGIDGVLEGTSLQTWVGISTLVVFVIAAASTYKYLSLRSGGRAVADLLGGRQLDPASTSLPERRLLNVVEEMALASGIPVPSVYVLDDAGINAFAAGLGTQDAIVGVTRGTLTALDRDELQGVIGHEFSHILNGDMHINLRLIAILHGILFLGLVGEILMRTRGRGRGRDGAPIVLLGLGLVVIGYAGTFFGNLIKAAVNRQREFLADAAAVQFTRNPQGIARALKKIGGSTAGSRVASSHSKEMSHLFFGQAVSFALPRLFATHPPLEERIRALEPRWDGRFIEGGVTAATPLPETVAAMSTDPAERVVAQVGTLPSLTAAQARLASFPDPLLCAARQPESAFALVQALFLSTDATIRDRQVRLLQDMTAAGALEASRASDQASPTSRLISFLPLVSPLDAIGRLTLLKLAAPALKELSSAQFRAMTEGVERLIRADAAVDLLEWVLQTTLLRELAPHFGASPVTPARRLTADQEDEAMATVLSAVARAGEAGDAASARAFAAGVAAFGRPLRRDTHEDPDFARLDQAMRTLRALSPLRKPRVIKACAACALVDGAKVAERALLAGIAAALDCPLPPDFAFEAR